MRYLAQSKPVKFRLKIGETECRSIEEVKLTSDFPSLWNNYKDGNLKKWLSQIGKDDYVKDVDKIKDETKRRLELYNLFSENSIEDNDYIKMFDRKIIDSDSFNEKCAKDSKLLKKYFETNYSVEHLNDTNIDTLLTQISDNKYIINLINQPESRIKKTTVNKLCVNNNELLDWCLNNQPDLLSDETIRLLIDNMRITDKQLILRIARKRKFEDILARFFIISIPVGSVSFNMIRVNDSFCIGEFPVTNILWETIMQTKLKIYCKYPEPDYCPVTMVHWKDCQDFIKKLNTETGRKFRLPTDDEWIYAAKDGSHSHNYRYSGSDDLGKVAWYDDNSDEMTHPVGKKQPNELGLYDMTGNVWEWVNDVFMRGTKQILLGGCFSSQSDECRLDNKQIASKDDYNSRVGFRLAMDLE